jgi:hypothetical protein
VPGARSRTEKKPSESAVVRQRSVVSARAKSSMRPPGRCFPATQSKSTPRTVPSVRVAPVEKTTSIGSFSTFPRRSLSPGSSVSRYVVLARNPSRGSISIPVRRQETRSRPSPGERITSDPSVEPIWLLPYWLPPPPPNDPPFPPPSVPLRPPDVAMGAERSFTTSSKRSSTERGRTFTLPVSGEIATTCGGSLSTGPPGGMPGCAQATTNSAAAALSRATARAVDGIGRRRPLTRRAPRSWRRAGRRACSTPAPSRARRPPRPRGPWR